MSGVRVEGVNARAKGRGVVPASLVNVSFATTDREVLAIVGAPKDGTSLLFDLIGGLAKPVTGRVGAPASPAIARISFEAPLPDALRVEEVAELASDLRGEPRRPIGERLGVLNLTALAKRHTRSLAVEERRAVSLALALTSTAVTVLLVEEPLVAIDPVAPRLVIDALRDASLTRGKTILATTASPRDAMRIGDRLGILTNGRYESLDPTHMVEDKAQLARENKSVSVRVVVTPAQGRAGATKLVAAIGNNEGITHVESHSARTSGAIALIVTGHDLAVVAKAITHAVAIVRVDVELIEPIALPLDALRVALAARAASPPPGSLPPGPPAGSLPPMSVPPMPPPPVPEQPPPAEGAPKA